MQLDEIWSFCGCKDKAIQQGASGFGSVWSWIGIDADSKLCVSYLVGTRDVDCACEFVRDVASRLSNRIQLTSDGYRPYVEAVDAAFQGQVDFAQLIKHYGADKSQDAERRFTPAVCTGCKPEAKAGDPDPEHISTSYVSART